MKLDKHKCIEKIVRYKKVTFSYKPDGRKGGKTVEVIDGINSNKKGYIHLPLDDCGNFDNKETKIPNGYKLQNSKKSRELIRKIARDFYCKNKKTKKVSKKLKNSLVFDNWYVKSREYWLTIQDILKLKLGEQIEVLLLHENVLDGPLTKFKRDVSYTPEKFFKSEKDTFVYNGGLDGVFKKYDGITSEPKGLDIECGKNKWGQKKHYTKYPKSKPVGFRGPMILWSDLKKLLNLYYPEE